MRLIHHKRGPVVKMCAGLTGTAVMGRNTRVMQIHRIDRGYFHNIAVAWQTVTWYPTEVHLRPLRLPATIVEGSGGAVTNDEYIDRL